MSFTYQEVKYNFYWSGPVLTVATQSNANSDLNQDVIIKSEVLYSKKSLPKDIVHELAKFGG